MNRTVWIIRVQDGNGWSDYPAIYGDVMLHEDSARSLAAKLASEKPDWSHENDIPRFVAVYKCEVIWEKQI